MTTPPSDMGSISWKPVIPKPKNQHLANTLLYPCHQPLTVHTGSPGEAKAAHVIMSSLITKQTQERIQHFEQQAGLRDAGYTPHKGLTTEETNYLRVAEALHVSLFS